MASVQDWSNEYGFGRPMSDTEIFMKELHKRAWYVLLRTLVVSYDEKPTMEQINEALKALMKWNPSLRMSIRKDSSNNWEFSENARAKPRLECLYNEEDWKKVMEDQLVQPLEDLNAPQFKCIYLPNAQHTQNDTNTNTCTFVFLFNHTIIDGMSTMATLRKFRLFLNDTVNGKTPNVEPWPKMHPPCEYFADRAFSQLPEEQRKEFESMPPMDISELLGKPCSFVDRLGTESKDNPNIPFSQGLSVRNFTEDETKAFRLACRANNTTIQAASQIAGSIALAKLMQKEGQEWEPLKIHYNLAANLRPHAAQEVSVDYTGIYVSLLFGHEVDVEKEINGESTWRETFWKLAQESSKKIREQIKDKSYLLGFFMMKEFAKQMDSVDNMESKKSEGRSEELLYNTSYGAWEFPTEETDQIKPVAIYSNSSIHLSGPIFNQQLVTVNGRLCWTFGWSKRVLSHGTAKRYADLMFDIIDKIIRDN